MNEDSLLPKQHRKPFSILVGLALIAGIGVGLLGGAFLWSLSQASAARDTALGWISEQETPFAILLVMAGVALCAGLAALLVRFVPVAAGSGVQEVEASIREQTSPARMNVIPVKFFGGILALGSGLALGREGPTVQLGATLGSGIARLARRSDAEVRQLQAALAGAGLAVAFNAPVGGAIFVFEELTRSLTVRTLITTTVGVAAAVSTSWLIIGSDRSFEMALPEAPSPWLLPVFMIFGLLTGALGVLYNSTVMGFLKVSDRMSRIPAPYRAALIGAVVGAVLFISPDAAGGGEHINQTLLNGTAIALPVLAALLLTRFFIGPLSYAAGTPGGLFSPLLALGALWGVIAATVLTSLFPGLGDLRVQLAVVGMSTFFAATVRAPLTGTVIVMEMTGATTLAVPMLAAAGCALFAATVLRSEPIYDSLRQRMLQTLFADGKTQK